MRLSAWLRSRFKPDVLVSVSYLHGAKYTVFLDLVAISSRALTVFSIFSAVVETPKEILMEQWACSSVSPMARSVADGVVDPALQAEPDDRQIPR